MTKRRRLGFVVGSTAMHHILRLSVLSSSCIPTSITSVAPVRAYGHHSGSISKVSYLDPKKSALNQLRNDIGKMNNLDDALDLYGEMVRMRPLPSVIDFTRLLGRVVKMMNYSAAISLYKNMCAKDVPVSGYTMNIVINCYCRERRVDLGFSVLVGFSKRGFVPNAITFNTLLKGLFRQHKIGEAQELFKKIVYEKLCQPNVVMINIVIDGLSKAGNTKRAIEFLRLMENGDAKAKLDAIPYNSIIDALCKDLMIDEAIGLFYEMIDKGISPNVITYSCLIRGLCNLGKWNEAKKLWAEMTNSGNAADVVTYSIMIDLLSKEGLMEDAKDVFDTMVQRGVTPNNFTYSALMYGYSLRGQIDEARRVFDSLVPDNVSYNTMIHGYFKNRKFEEAMQLFQEMQGKGLNPTITSYTIVLKGLFQFGRCDAAKKLFDEIQLSSLTPDFRTYCVMLNGLCKNEHVDEALELLQKMEIGGVELHVSMYTIILDKFCRSGRLDRARDIFNSLSLKGLDPNVITYRIMIHAFCKQGLLEEAKMLIVEMEAKGCMADEVVYNTIVRGLLLWGKHDDALVYLDEMYKKGFTLFPATLSCVLDLISGKERGDFHRILKKFYSTGRCTKLSS